MTALDKEKDVVRQVRHHPAELDAIYRRILGALAEDASRSYAERSKIVQLSAPAVHDRVKRLKHNGVIKGTVAVRARRRPTGRDAGRPSSGCSLAACLRGKNECDLAFVRIEKRASINRTLDMGYSGHAGTIGRERPGRGRGALAPFQRQARAVRKAGAFPVWRVTIGDVPGSAAGWKRTVTGSRSWSGCPDDAQPAKTRQWDRAQAGQA
ncbi:AsnC family transcriptional regulator [Paracoccus aminovorans]|nr:AsnC family transcriptional regulator [Paracoccus aminovorans]